MPRTRALALAALTAGLLTFAPSAQADLTVSTSGDATVVTGDAGANRIQVQDGNLSAPEPYAFAFYSEDGEAILEGGNSTCATDGGGGGGVENVYCGSSTVDKVVFNLGAGNDTLGWFNDSNFDALGGLTADFGPGSDENESGLRGVPTVLRGGADNDNLGGLDGPSSVVEGGPGADRIVGGTELSGETLRGGDGDDEVQGLNGNDQIFGDGGNDSLVGGSGGDTITGGPGQDNVEGDGVPNAFSGNDTLLLNDGERDVGVCGFGADTVDVDALDLLPAQDCESVTRPAAGGGTGGPPPGGGTAAGSARVTLAKPGTLSAKKRKLSLKVTCPASASGSCSGRVTFTARFTERGKKRKLSLGTVPFTLQPGASKTVSRKLSKKVVRRLRRAKKRKLTVKATSRDNAGTSFSSSRTATLKVGR